MYNKIARINVYNKTEKEYQRIKQEINADMIANNIKVYNSSLCRFEEFRGHWGNYCLPNIPYEKAVEYANKYNLTVDLIKNIIQKSDIENLKIGDKVSYTVYGLFGSGLSKGTIVNKNENSITVRLYRSKTKGNVIRVGQEGEIIKGWDIYNSMYKELVII